MRAASHSGLSAALVVLTIALFVPPALAAGTTMLVSRQSAVDGGAGADGVSNVASVSADGRYVAFDSTADNLSTADNNNVYNVFVRDLLTNTTILVSRRSAVDGGAAADGDADDPSISASGRYVAFYSDADNLSAVDNNNVANVFLRDLATSTTTLVSRQSDADGGVGANANSVEATVSADGRFVAFDSDATNLSAADSDSAKDVFLRDLATDTTTLVSRQSDADGGAGADGGSIFWSELSVSADGRYVAFDSDADNLSSVDNNTVWNVFVRDLATSTTTLVSRQSDADGGAGGDANSFEPSISGDGRHVAFGSDADNLGAADDDSVTDVFVRDLLANTTTLASRQSETDGGSGGDGNASGPSLSADGRFVAFGSMADNLSSADDNDVYNVFLRDVMANTTQLVSRQSDVDGGAGADSESAWPSVSADGRYVAFVSSADNLSTADTDGSADAFLRDVASPQLPVSPMEPPPPTPPAATVTPPATPSLTLKPPSSRASAARAFVLPSANVCLRRGARLRLRYKKPQGMIIDRVEVFVGKKRVLLRTGSKARASITLARLPAKTFRLTLKIKPRGSKAATVTRTYRVCQLNRG